MITYLRAHSSAHRRGDLVDYVSLVANASPPLDPVNITYNVETSSVVVLAYYGSKVCGGVTLKNASDSWRDYIHTKTGIELPINELGYKVMTPPLSGMGLSTPLSGMCIAGYNDRRIFAVIPASNQQSVSTLRSLRFTHRASFEGRTGNPLILLMKEPFSWPQTHATGTSASQTELTPSSENSIPSSTRIDPSFYDLNTSAPPPPLKQCEIFSLPLTA